MTLAASSRKAWTLAGLSGMAVALGLAAQEPAAPPANEIQRQFYDGLVERGVDPAIAEVMTIDTEIIAADERQLHLVQTLIGGGRRELILRREASPDSGPLVPLMLDDGQVIRASRLAVSGPPGGYRLEAAYLAPADVAALGQEVRPELLPLHLLSEILGIAGARAQLSVPEMAIAVVDSFNAPVQSSGAPPSAGPQGFVDAAAASLTSPTGDLVQAATEVGGMLRDNAAQTGVLDRIAEGAKSVAGVLKHAAGTYKTYQEYKAQEAVLAAAYDCAENPTEPTAIDALRNDPNYHRATTERIRSARNELKLHYGIKMFTSTANEVASNLLDAQGTPAGKAWSKGVGILDKVEDAMLNHVAEEYIMKDATKGVVPCRNTCEPVYSPAPPPEALASYPPASMSCGNPAPDQLVCSAGPPAPASSSPPPPPPASLSCGILTSAVFTYSYEYSASGCSFSIACESNKLDRGFQGSAALTATGTKGYDGKGQGTWQETQSRETSSTAPGACMWTRSGSHTAGAGDLRVTARFSIDTPDVGGLDTGGMSADTSVVEIMVEGEVPYNSSHEDCHGVTHNAWTTSLGLSCHFYGVDLYRGGFYKIYRTGDPSSGVCTLSLSR
jgi:hypothetical protein